MNNNQINEVAVCIRKNIYQPPIFPKSKDSGTQYLSPKPFDFKLNLYLLLKTLVELTMADSQPFCAGHH